MPTKSKSPTTTKRGRAGALVQRRLPAGGPAALPLMMSLSSLSQAGNRQGSAPSNWPSNN